MSYVTTKQMLSKAQSGGYAVGAFNAENMEMVQAIIAAAESESAPVIIQTTPSTVKYASTDLYYGNVYALAKKASVPVALHLDHGDSFDLTVNAMVSGYSSVMIDGSKLSFEENISLTKSVVDLAEKFGLPVEGELGMLAGKEDSLVSSESCYTDPSAAQEFAEKSGVFSLAVAIGTAHGVYAAEPKLDIDRLKEIRKKVSLPLVLHGASGLSDEQIRRTIEGGICKVNFATELRIAFSDAVKEFLQKNPAAFDPKKYLAAGRSAVTALVCNRIRVCGCAGRA